MLRYNLIIIFLLGTFFSFAQEQNSPNILWKSLQSEHFEVIFPSEIENEAQRVANTLEWTYGFDTKSLKVKPKPISMVLYNRSNTSNAYAALMPRRMGWYLTPPQSVTGLGSVDWVHTLAIHEYRHVVQYAKNRQHFTKFMTYFFGDIGQAMMRWSIPDWFYEGDAIVMETALTKLGRGRIPAFAMNIRSYSLNNEKFTYDQAYLGSYKRYYPSHYHLGYPLTAYARINYGKDIWDKVLDKTNRISWWPYAFDAGLKKYTGLSTKKLYQKAMTDYHAIWSKQDSMVVVSDRKIVNKKKKKSWTIYSNPQYKNDGSIICRKTSLDKIGAFYEVKPNGTESKIKNTDASLFNLNAEKIVWSRTIPSVRWGEEAFSDVMVYNIKTGEEKQLTNGKQYLSPSLSPDGKTIAVVEHDGSQQTKILLLDANTGQVLKSYDKVGGENDYCRTPVWSENGEYIAFTHGKYKGMALTMINVKTDEIKKIIDYGWDNIGRPVFYKNYILYNSDYSGIGNIYAVDIETGQNYQLTSSRYGAYNATVLADASKMAYEEYNVQGYDIAEIDLQPDSWKKLNEVKQTDPQYYQPLVEQEGSQTIDGGNISNTKYPVTDYKKSKDAVKFHSWGAFPVSPYIDVRVMSDNYLNTLSIMGGYLYNTNEQTRGGYLAFGYSKYFPMFSMVASQIQRKQVYEYTDDTITYNWNESKLKAEISVPLNLSRNVYNTSLSVKTGLEYTYVNGLAERIDLYVPQNGSLTPLYASLSFKNYQKYAYRDFAPRFGQSLNFDYKKIMPYDSDYEGYWFSARSGFYFPGLMANHSLKLGGSYEKQLTYDRNNPERYYFSKKTKFARGYKSYAMDEFYKLSIDYQFPLWCPDLSIGPVLYIKRIRLGGFYDYLEGNPLGLNKRTYESVGANIRFEFNIFRINYPLEVGWQYAYRINDGGYKISFLLLGLPI